MTFSGAQRPLQGCMSGGFFIYRALILVKGCLARPRASVFAAKWCGGEQEKSAPQWDENHLTMNASALPLGSDFGGG